MYYVEPPVAGEPISRRRACKCPHASSRRRSLRLLDTNTTLRVCRGSGPLLWRRAGPSRGPEGRPGKGGLAPELREIIPRKERGSSLGREALCSLALICGCTYYGVCMYSGAENYSSGHACMECQGVIRGGFRPGPTVTSPSTPIVRTTPRSPRSVHTHPSFFSLGGPGTTVTPRASTSCQGEIVRT